VTSIGSVAGERKDTHYVKWRKRRRRRRRRRKEVNVELGELGERSRAIYEVKSIQRPPKNSNNNRVIIRLCHDRISRDSVEPTGGGRRRRRRGPRKGFPAKPLTKAVRPS